MFDLFDKWGIVVKKPKLREKQKKLDVYELYLKQKSLNDREAEMLGELSQKVR